MLERLSHRTWKMHVSSTLNQTRVKISQIPLVAFASLHSFEHSGRTAKLWSQLKTWWLGCEQACVSIRMAALALFLFSHLEAFEPSERIAEAEKHSIQLKGIMDMRARSTEDVMVRSSLFYCLATRAPCFCCVTGALLLLVSGQLMQNSSSSRRKQMKKKQIPVSLLIQMVTRARMTVRPIVTAKRFFNLGGW